MQVMMAERMKRGIKAEMEEAREILDAYVEENRALVDLLAKGRRHVQDLQLAASTFKPEDSDEANMARVRAATGGSADLAMSLLVISAHIGLWKCLAGSSHLQAKGLRQGQQRRCHRGLCSFADKFLLNCVGLGAGDAGPGGARRRAAVRMHRFIDLEQQSARTAIQSCAFSSQVVRELSGLVAGANALLSGSKGREYI